MDTQTTIIEFISMVTVLETTSKFIAKEKFVVNTERSATVKISRLSNNFIEWFLSGDGKTEDPISEQTLRYGYLLQASASDGSIIEEFGVSEAKAETTLSEVFSLMRKQRNGEDGALGNTCHANIFYVKDQKGILRRVCVNWLIRSGWFLSADQVQHKELLWSADLQIFVRN